MSESVLDRDRWTAAWRPGSPRAATAAQAALVLLLAGCAEPKPKPQPAEQPRYVSPHKAVDPLARESSSGDDDMQVQGLMGTLDHSQIDEGLRRTLPEASRCFEQEARRMPYLGGEMMLKFRVAGDGTVERLRLVRTTLGSYDVERCVLDKLEQSRFPHPSGGRTAEFDYPLTFPARMSVEQWDPERVKKGLAELRKRERKRRRRQRRARRRGRRRKPVDPRFVAPRGLMVTAYVNRRGRVASVGMYARAPVQAETAEQLTQLLARARFDTPFNRYAKVSFRW